jgi:CBS domain containing-hemolysin-like protein
MEDPLGLALELAAAAVLLVTLRALGAAFEAALTALGVPRAEALAADPEAGVRARALGRVVSKPESAAAAMRLFVALTSLSAGALFAAAAAQLPAGARVVPMAGAVLLGALLSVGLASAGRRAGATRPERVALLLAPLVRALTALLAPVARIVGLAVAPLCGGPGRFTLPLPPIEEVERALAAHARSQDPADRTSELIHRVLEFREKVARDIMVPRTEVLAIDVDMPVPEIIVLLAEEGHSRVPVYEGSLDKVVGILHARDLVPLLTNPELIVLRDLLRAPTFMPWSTPIQVLLRAMQRKHQHMMIVVDEYGGVMGVVTLEDVLEEIVGEIRDEWDADEGGAVEALPDGSFLVRGDAPVAEFNETTGAGIPAQGSYETVAGFLVGLAGAIPARGDRLRWRDWVFTISETDGRRVRRVRVLREGRPKA